MNASTTLKKFGLEQAFHYIYRDPEKNMLRIMDWADKFARSILIIPTCAGFLRMLTRM